MRRYLLPTSSTGTCAFTTTRTSTMGARLAIDRDRKEEARKDTVNVHSASVPDFPRASKVVSFVVGVPCTCGVLTA